MKAQNSFYANEPINILFSRTPTLCLARASTSDNNLVINKILKKKRNYKKLSTKSVLDAKHAILIWTKVKVANENTN
jgi:hypothetical protein